MKISYKFSFFNLLAVSLVFAGVCLAAACAPADADRRMVLITFDSLRTDRLAAYGASTSMMPRLDQMAAGGTVFTEAWSPAPITLPALAGMMTGRIPSATGVVDDQGSVLAGDAPRLAAHLLQGGWATGLFVNAPFLHENSGLHEGFRRVFQAGGDQNTRGRSALTLFQEALEFLELQRKVPAFAWIHVYDTHYPYLGQDVGGVGVERYDAAVAAADSALAKFLSELERRGLIDDTLIVVAADHGESLGEGGEGTHGQYLSPQALRIPWVVQQPGNSTPQRIETPVSLLDMAPTLAELAGVKDWPAGGPLDGRSQAAALAGQAPDDDRQRLLYAESYAPYFSYHWQPLRHIRQAGEDRIAVPGSDGVPAPPDLGPEKATAPSEDERQAVLRGAETVAMALSSGRFNAAAAALENMPPAATATPMYARMEAAIHRGLGQPEQAVAGLSQAARTAGNCAELWLALARLQDELGRPSLAAWEAVADSAGMRIQFHLNRARQLMLRGRSEEAMAAAREAVAGRPASATLDAALGRIYLEAGQVAEAQRLLAEAATHQPGSSATYRDLARVAVAGGAMEGAMELLQEAQRIDPAETSLKQDMGDLHAREGRHDEARQAWRLSLPAGSAEPGASLTVAEQFLRLGLVDEAAADVDAVRVKHPDAPQAHYIMGQVALARSDPKGAREELLAALSTGGEQPAIYFSLARAALMEENENEALGYLQRVFAADDQVLRRALQTDRLLATPGRFPQVKAAVERYLAGGVIPPANTDEDSTGTP